MIRRPDLQDAISIAACCLFIAVCCAALVYAVQYPDICRDPHCQAHHPEPAP